MLHGLGSFIVVLVALLVFSGHFLVIDRPEKADLIVVLAGETERRPQRGLELLNQHYAPELMLDVPAGTTVYAWDQLELAQRYVDQLAAHDQVKICPIIGQSTKEEAGDVWRCLQNFHGHNILLVTSDFHTRRALETFARAFSNFHFSVAAAYDDREFGEQWWRRRQWAKTNLLEFSKFVWWQVIERWSR